MSSLCECELYQATVSQCAASYFSFMLQEIATFMRVLGSYPLDEMAALAGSLDNGAVQTLKQQMKGPSLKPATDASAAASQVADASELPNASAAALVGLSSGQICIACTWWLAVHACHYLL